MDRLKRLFLNATLAGAAASLILVLFTPHSAGAITLDVDASTYNLSSGAIIYNLEHIGIDNTGTFNHTGGTNTTSTLYLGHNFWGVGTYNLSGTGTLSAIAEYIGNAGTGEFNQSGGTNTTDYLYLGYSTTGRGTYNLSGGVLTAYEETIGNERDGDFFQTGGTNTVTTNLYLGRLGTSSGDYTISGGTLDVGGDIVNGTGTGKLSIDGGTLNLGGSIVNGSGTSTLALNGGTLNVTGGIDVDNFIIADIFAPFGSFTLGAGDNLTAGYEYVGYSGDGTLNQTGGTNTVLTDMYVGRLWGSAGTVDQSGGTTTVTNDLHLAYLNTTTGPRTQGTYNLSGGTLNVGGNIVTGEGDAYLNITGGVLNLTGDIVVGSSSGWSHLNIDGGTLNGPGAVAVDFFRVGNAAGSNGSHAIGAGASVTALHEDIGYEGTGTLTQTGGTNAVSFSLYLGYTPTGDGTYDLSGGALTAMDEYVGKGGTGAFIQSGGTNTVTDDLVLGDRYLDPGGSGYIYGTGTYDLSGGALSAANEYVGRWSDGVFNQTGGTNTVTGDLYIANYSGSTSSYNLSGGTLDVGGSIISGPGSTSQLNIDGGTLNVAGDIDVATLHVGDSLGSNGGHTLGAGQNISTKWERIGVGGSGALTQTGGTNTVAYYMTVGDRYWDGSTWHYSTGAYDLSGGALSSNSMSVGGGGNGAFTQSGGTNTIAGDLGLGSITGNGTYDLSGGTLSVGGSIVNLPGGTSTLNIDGGALVIGGDIDVDTLLVGNAAGTSGVHTLGAGQSLTAGIEHIGLAGAGTLNQAGGTHTVDTTLYVGFDTGSSGTYKLIDGLLTATDEYVGNWGTGEFKQSGGTNTIANDLNMGWNPSGAGTYTIAGGTLDVGGAIVNGVGASTLSLDGGTLNASAVDVDTLLVGSTSGTVGSHTIAGGQTVFAVNENVGHVGTGTVSQTGGNNLVTNGLGVGVGSSAVGIYNLSSSGVLQADYETIGASGAGLFTQTGSTINLVNNAMYLGLNSGGAGVYSMSNGTLMAGDINVGFSGSGAFNQSGGVNIVSGAVTIAANPGSSGAYNLTGGVLNAGSIVNNDTFNYNGGALNAGTMTNNQALNLSGAGTRVVNGDVTNYGAVSVTNTTVNWAGTYTEYGTYVSDPSDNYFTDLVIGSSGYLVGGVGDNFYVSGNFLNSSTQGALWNTTGSTLAFTGPGIHEFYLADWASAGQFGWGTLELAGSGSLTFTGGFTGDLFVDNLIVGAGTILDLNGFNLYYNTLTDLGGTFTGGAPKSAVPEPATMLLLAGGLAGLAGLKRRLRG